MSEAKYEFLKGTIPGLFCVIFPNVWHETSNGTFWHIYNFCFTHLVPSFGIFWTNLVALPFGSKRDQQMAPNVSSIPNMSKHVSPLCLKLPMTGSEPQIVGVRRHHSAKCTTAYKHVSPLCLKLPMTGSEPQIVGVRRHHSAKCTTAYTPSVSSANVWKFKLLLSEFSTLY